MCLVSMIRRKIIRTVVCHVVYSVLCAVLTDERGTDGLVVGFVIVVFCVFFCLQLKVKVKVRVNTNAWSITQKRMISKCTNLVHEMHILQAIWFWVERLRLGLAAIRRWFILFLLWFGCQYQCN